MVANGSAFVNRGVTKMTSVVYAKMIKALQEKPQSAHTIAEITGLHHITASEYLRALHKVQAAHVSAWAKDIRGRDTTAMFSLGFRPDKPRRIKSKAEVQRDYKLRQKHKCAEYPMEKAPRRKESMLGLDLMNIWNAKPTAGDNHAA